MIAAYSYIRSSIAPAGLIKPVNTYPLLLMPLNLLLPESSADNPSIASSMDSVDIVSGHCPAGVLEQRVDFIIMSTYCKQSKEDRT